MSSGHAITPFIVAHRQQAGGTQLAVIKVKA